MSENKTEMLSPDERTWWMIKVTGYGEFEHFGTAAEAEQMRVHKAEWEGGRGTKRKAGAVEIAVARADIKSMVKRGCGWDRTSEREIESIRDAFGGTLPEGVRLMKEDEL